MDRELPPEWVEVEKRLEAAAKLRIAPSPPEKQFSDEDHLKAIRKAGRRNPVHEFLVRGAYLRCNFGTHGRRLNLFLSHGVYSYDRPLVNENDCTYGEGKHVTTFGVCGAPDCPRSGSVRLFMEEYDPITGYRRPDAGKSMTGCPCQIRLIGKWRDPHKKFTFDGGRAVTTNSFLCCEFGGVITPITSGQDYLRPLESKSGKRMWAGGAGAPPMIPNPKTGDAYALLSKVFDPDNEFGVNMVRDDTAAAQIVIPEKIIPEMFFTSLNPGLSALDKMIIAVLGLSSGGTPYNRFAGKHVYGNHRDIENAKKYLPEYDGHNDGYTYHYTDLDWDGAVLPGAIVLGGEAAVGGVGADAQAEFLRLYGETSEDTKRAVAAYAHKLEQERGEPKLVAYNRPLYVWEYLKEDVPDEVRQGTIEAREYLENLLRFDLGTSFIEDYSCGDYYFTRLEHLRWNASIAKIYKDIGVFGLNWAINTVILLPDTNMGIPWISVTIAALAGLGYTIKSTDSSGQVKTETPVSPQDTEALRQALFVNGSPYRYLINTSKYDDGSLYKTSSTLPRERFVEAIEDHIATYRVTDFSNSANKDQRERIYRYYLRTVINLNTAYDASYQQMESEIERESQSGWASFPNIVRLTN
ncbi:MAG: DUF4280 domain-containing protein [Gracilibacteraceae bacterium]|jgi:hypothetical protein|nr:DUF4280 domain-containing protein [Gracilibacteraceae bacterium]